MARQRAPGWYSDPDAPGHWRWWDGQAWTEHAVSAFPVEVRSGPEPEDALPRGPRAGEPEPTRVVPLLPPSPGTLPSPAATPSPSGGPAGAGDAGSDATVTAPSDVTVTRSEPSGAHAELSGAPGRAGSGTGRGGGPQPGERPGRRPARPGRKDPSIIVRRWLVLAVVVLVVVIVLVVALHGRPPTLYWEGEPLTNGRQVLTKAELAMKQVSDANEGVVGPQSRCYYSLATKSSHDVGTSLFCGPVLFPWSSPSEPWITFKLDGSLKSSGEKLSLAPGPAPDETIGLAGDLVLRRPDGLSPPVGSGDLSVPAAPYQPAGWGDLLASTPNDLATAPVGDLIGDWGQSYRLVAYGEVSRLSAKLDPGALRSAVNPAGSAWATTRQGANSSRPLATLLLPPRGDTFVVAEIALGPGEASGAVPVGAGAAVSDQATLEVVDGASTITFPSLSPRTAGNVTLAAAVPLESNPVLQVTDKGLAQTLSLADGRLGAAPGILSRAGTDEPMSVNGALGTVAVHVSDASLVWFAGSDGGTVPPNADEAYLQVLATTTPSDATSVSASSFSLQVGNGQALRGQALPSSDRQAVVVGFLVPASFSDGTVTVSANGHSFDFPVHFA